MASIRDELRRRAAERARSLLARLLVMVATGGCAAPLDLPLSPEAPSGAVPVVTVERVAPLLAKAGDTLTLAFTADGAITGCAASLENGASSSEARCELAPPARCACTLFVDGTVPDGSARLSMRATNALGTGRAERAVQVDTVAPVVEPGSVVIRREPVGTNDRVEGLTRAASDPGTAYAERKVVEVRLFLAGETRPFTSAPVRPDGSFAPVEIPGSEGLSTATQAPALVLASAVDAAGNETVTPVALTRGADAAGPAADGTRLAFRRHGHDRPDAVLGLPGALSDDASAVVSVRLYDAATEGRLVGAQAVAADGSFEELPVGTATAAPAQLWAAGVDKCGREGPRAPVQAGSASEPPAVDGSAVSYARRPLGEADLLMLRTGAVTSACAPVAAKAWGDGKGVMLLGAAALDAAGAAAVAVGTATRAPARAWVTVQDKCGLETTQPVEALGSGHGAPPAIDGRLVTIERREVGVRDAVRGAPGAVVPACHLVSVALSSDEDGARVEARAEPNADGSFEAVSLGTPSHAPARVWVAATDKCGLTSERPVEAMNGAALGGPVVDPSLVRVARRPVGTTDGIEALAGAVTGTCGLASMELTFEVGSSTFAMDPALRGGFAERALGTATSAPAVVRASATDKCGLRGLPVVVTPAAAAASVDAGRLAIVRRDAASADAVRGESGAVQPGTCAPASAEWTDVETGAAIARAGVTTDGAIEERPAGTAVSAPGRARVTVTDKCGLVSAAVEATSGAAVRGPAVDGTRLAYARRPLGVPDVAQGRAGAVLAGTCAITRVEALDAERRPLAAATLASDGSFADLAVGSATSSPREVSLAATDKCGLVSPAVTFPSSDATAPSVRADRLVLVAASGRFRVAGQAGAAADEHAGTVRVGLCPGLPCDLARATSTFAPAADGSFPEQPVSSEGVRVFAFDKAGNLSEPVAPATARRSLSMGDGPHVAHMASLDLDPRTATPALALAVAAPEADPSVLAGADGTSLVTTAASETDDVALAWADHTPAGRHDGALVFAGVARPLAVWGGTSGHVELAEWDGTRWHPVAASGAPTARTGFAFAVDSARGLGLLFGGEGSGVAAGETWTLALSTRTWTRLAPPASGGAMNLRGRCALAYDERRGRFVLTGSPASGASYAMETWTLDPASPAWRKQPGLGPAARLGHASTYDSRRGLTLVHGGTLVMENPARPSCELWALDGDAWSRLDDDACLAGPSARSGHTLTYDPARDRLVLFGGESRTRIATTYLDGLSNELWVRADGYWYDLGTQAPLAARAAHAAAFDPARAQVVVAGGLDESRRSLGDTWGYDADARQWAPWSASPAARTLAAAAFDPRRSATVVAGGVAYEAGGLEPFHWLQDVGLRGATAWSPHRPTGATGPGGRSGAAAAYDPISGRVLLVGGTRPGLERAASWTSALAGDVWSLGEAGYAAVTRGDAIPVRASAGAAFDAVRGRLVVFGGTGPAGVRGDTWEVDPATGAASEVKVASPPARTLAAMAYDPVRGVTVLFGGSADGTTSTLLDDTWAYDGRTWRQVPTRGAWPAPRLGASLAFDTARGRLVLFGGATPMLANDAWSFDGAEWTPLTVAGPRPTPAWGRAMAWDAHRGAMVLFGGTTTPHAASPAGSAQSDETWTLEGRTPHARWATQLFGFALGKGQARAAGVRYTGRGTGGVELLAWKASERAWVRLGGASAAELVAALPGEASDYVTEAGRVWVVATTPSGSSAGAASEVVTDALSMWVDEAR